MDSSMNDSNEEFEYFGKIEEQANKFGFKKKKIFIALSKFKIDLLCEVYHSARGKGAAALNGNFIVE